MNENSKTHERQIQSESKPAVGQYRPLFHSGISCPNCKQTVDKYYELCPNCGYRLHSTHCTFCGAPMESEDLYCGECGGYAQGIKCPSCGTLSFRSFCPKCNQAVDELGKEELQKAKEDPVYQRICALAEKIIKAQENGSFATNEKEPLPSHIINLLEKYRSLQISIPDAEKSEPAESKDTKVAIEHDKDIKLTDSADAPTDFSSAIEELNALLKSMIPNPGLTPQMQRNYFCARKVAVFHKSKVKETVGWVCNLCGFLHHSPSECNRPELGGRWVYKERETITKTYE